MPLKVNETTPEVDAMRPSLDKMAALVGGTEAMRAAGKKYLPQWPLEKDPAYTFRLNTSTLYNATGWTLNNLSAKPFQEPINVKVDSEVEKWLDNVDLCGNKLDGAAKEWFHGGLQDSLMHVLIDFPVTLDEAGNPRYKTRADEMAAGVRPYAVHIKHSQVLGWIVSYTNGNERLEQVRFMECEEEPDGEWGTKKIEQVRVLMPGVWQKWRKSENKDEWVLFAEGTTTLDFVPFLTFYTDRTGFMQGKPPLEDLADLNIKHWQSQSDQDSLLHTARVPLLARFGLQDDQEEAANIGKAIMDLPLGADMKYVEHSGAAIGAGRESLQDLEGQMQAMGAELLTVKPGDRSATEAAIDSAQAQSQLSTMAEKFGEFLEKVLDTMAIWAGRPVGAEVDVFNDFASIDINAQTVLPFTNAIVSMINNGLLDDESAFGELQRYGIINPDLVWADVQAKVDAQGPSLLKQVLPSNPLKLPTQNKDVQNG